MDLETAWRLACAWYHDRLDPAWRRPAAAEAQQMFDSLGLRGTFWRLPH